MSSKLYNSTIKEEKNVFNTKDKALMKAAKDVTKVCRQKTLKNCSTLCDYNNHPNRSAFLFKSGAAVQTGLTAKYFRKHENQSYVDGGSGRKDEKIQEAEASSFEQRILHGFKKSAVLAEEFARRKEKAIGRAIESASRAKVEAEMSRKSADDTEKELRMASLLGCASFCEILHDLQESAVLAEEYAKRKEGAIERAIECAYFAKVTAKMARETAEDVEISIKRFRRELRANFSRTDTQIVNDREKEDSSGLGLGIDSLQLYT